MECFFKNLWVPPVIEYYLVFTYLLTTASAVREEVEETAGRTTSAGTRVVKSRQVPLTSQLSRTTRRNYRTRDRITYVPYGTGSSVRHIGDKTSFNVHLNKNQVFAIFVIMIL